MVKFKHLLFSLLIFINALFVFSPETEASSRSNFIRIKGDNRLQTAIRISEFAWPEGLDSTEKSVILARADEPADALSAASLAGVKDAPILLTYSTQIGEEVISEITRLGTKKVYILGGTAAISLNVENKLKTVVPTVQRISGATRYETAKRINEVAGLNSNSKIILVNGKKVADALSASSEAAINRVPIYLSTETTIPSQIPNTVKEVVIYGGHSVVTQTVENSLKSKGIKVTRISGNDRFETNVAAVNSSTIVSEQYILVRGTSVSPGREDYPDAVSASGLAHRLGANIILVHPDYTHEAVLNLLSTKPLPSFVLGGEQAIKDYMIIYYGYWKLIDNFTFNNTLPNVAAYGSFLSLTADLGTTKEEVIEKLGYPILNYEADYENNIPPMLVYPNHSVFFDELGIAIRMSVYGEVLNLDIGQVIDTLGEPDEADFDQKNQAWYVSYDLGEYGLYFYTSSDETDVKISEVELALLEE